MGRRWPCWAKPGKKPGRKSALSSFPFPKLSSLCRLQRLPSGCGCPPCKAACLLQAAEGWGRTGPDPQAQSPQWVIPQSYSNTCRQEREMWMRPPDPRKQAATAEMPQGRALAPRPGHETRKGRGRAKGVRPEVPAWRPLCEHPQ